MSVLIILIVVSLTLAILFLGLFSWAVRSGQYHDTDSPAIRLLYEEKQSNKKSKTKNHQQSARPDKNHVSA